MACVPSCRVHAFVSEWAVAVICDKEGRDHARWGVTANWYVRLLAGVCLHYGERNHSLSCLCYGGPVSSVFVRRAVLIPVIQQGYVRQYKFYAAL